MKLTALVCLFALLQGFGMRVAGMPENVPEHPGPGVQSPGIEAASTNRVLAFEQPALWIPGARSRREVGTLPGPLTVDRGRLLFSETGLRYTERIEDRVPELLDIPRARLVSASMEPSEHGVAILLVTESGGPEEKIRAHLFVILPAEPDAVGRIASWAEALRDDRRAAAIRPPDGAAVREETIFVVATQWQPVIVFDDPPPAISGHPDRLAESVKAGARIGAAPVSALCSHGGCNPVDALIVGVPMAAAGAIVGAIVGIGREISASFQKNLPQPPGFSPDELQSKSPVLVTAAIESLTHAEFQSCVTSRLSSGKGTKEPLRWYSGVRVATLVPGDEASRDGHYVIEVSLSSVSLVPESAPGQEAADVPARLVLQAGLRFNDPANGTSRALSAEWRAGQHSLREWANDDGALLRESLGKGCVALADQLLGVAEHAWLGL